VIHLRHNGVSLRFAKYKWKNAYYKKMGRTLLESIIVQFIGQPYYAPQSDFVSVSFATDKS